MKNLKTWYNKQKYAKPIIFIFGFALLGGLILLLSRAAGPFASVETENANLSGVTKQTDANASGGSYLQFGSGSSSADVIPATLFAMHYQGNIPTVPMGMIAKGSGEVWPYIEKSRGVRNWSQIDSYVATAKSKGIPFVYNFEYVPGWAVADKSSGCSTLYDGTPYCAKKPDNMADLTNFITAFVARYCPSGVPSIPYFELYNEPYNTVAGYRLPPADLALMTREMYRIIKSNCPAMKIVSPSMAVATGTTGWYNGYLSDYFKALGPIGTDPVDVASIHYYTNESGGTPGVQPEDILDASLLNLISTYAPGKPIWNTEGSWGRNYLTQDQEVGFIARFHLLHWSKGYSSVHWYQWENGSYGTLCGGGYPCTPRPAQTTAYAQTYNWMVGAKMSKKCAEQSGVYTCELTRDNGYKALAVWNKSGSSTFSVPSGYTRYRTLAGSTVQISGNSVSTGIKPILLENQ